MWWEKTVEYLFVAQMLEKRRVDFAAPISGRYEVSGDALISSDSRLILIEFKRSMSDLDVEKTKFDCYDSAAKALGKKDAFHLLVFGALGESSQLELRAKRYFSRTDVVDMVALPDLGGEKASFDAYLEELIEYKSSDKRGTGKIGSGSFDAVVGVVQKNGILSCMSLGEYVSQVAPQLGQAEQPQESAFPVPGG